MMNREEYNKSIDEIKEVLSNMPLNNKKNKLKYIDYIKENLNSYRDNENKFILELTKRDEEILKRIGKGGIDFSGDNSDELLEKLFILNKWNTPYEKIGLDKIVYEINHYYKDNLESLNSDIKNAIECFDKVGIKLKSSDFNFSKYVHQYMEIMLGSDSSRAIGKIDELFWKSPNMIHGIAMNFNYLYIKYEKYFVNYYRGISKDIVNSYNDILDKYNEILVQKKEHDFDIRVIDNKFMNGELNIKDYSSDKLDTYVNSLGSKSIVMDNFLKLYDSLYEYKMYKEYKFIIDKFIELYNNKASFKNSYKNLIKDINKVYGKIFKTNKKIDSKWFNNDSKKELLELELNNTLEELRDKDGNLCIEKINEVISNLNDSISYLDILNLIGFNYVYFKSIILENQEGISYDEVVSSQEKLKSFLCNNNLTFLDNIKVMDNANIPQIIGDRYKLMDINISEEDIDNNYDNYMDIIDKIRVIKSIESSKVSYDEMLFRVNVKDIVKK